tara:strand:- start:23207 stop:23455 length:249 start_codon:yes stop_codon:yes gene_type:complete
MSALQRVTDSLDEKEDDAEQYLTFLLVDEEYEVTTLRVQETKRWDCVILIANSSPYLCGVSNLGGSIEPVVDLCLNSGRQTL